MQEQLISEQKLIMHKGKEGLSHEVTKIKRLITLKAKSHQTDTKQAQPCE